MHSQYIHSTHTIYPQTQLKEIHPNIPKPTHTRVSDAFYFDAYPDPRIRIEKYGSGSDIVNPTSNLFLLKF